jgi:hypothetical protein
MHITFEETLMSKKKQYPKKHPLSNLESRDSGRLESHETEVVSFTSAPGTVEFLKKFALERGLRIGSRANMSELLRRAIEHFALSNKHDMTPELQKEFEELRKKYFGG